MTYFSSSNTGVTLSDAQGGLPVGLGDHRWCRGSNPGLNLSQSMPIKHQPPNFSVWPPNSPYLSLIPVLYTWCSVKLSRGTRKGEPEGCSFPVEKSVSSLHMCRALLVQGHTRSCTGTLEGLCHPGSRGKEYQVMVIDRGQIGSIFV